MNWKLTFDLVNFYSYMTLWTFMYIRYWKGLWKGVCGGNGIPQPDEWIRFVATVVFIWESGIVMFMHQESDIPFMVLILGAITATTIKNMDMRSVMPGLNKKEETKREKLSEAL